MGYWKDIDLRMSEAARNPRRLAPITVTGHLVTHDSEGGYAPDGLLIDGWELSYTIAERCGTLVQGKYTPEFHEYGRVRITVEFLGDDAESESPKTEASN